jgi:hypothetical protein
MEKLIRDGKVGVLISVGYGAGFYTWGAPLEAIFSPTLISLIESEEYAEAEEFVKTNWEGVYTGGIDDLTVRWLPIGTKFIIEEFDGNESVVLYEDMNWITAYRYNNMDKKLNTNINN